MECCRHSVDSCDLVSGIVTYKRRELFTDIFKQVSDINSESVPIESKVSYTLPMEERRRIHHSAAPFTASEELIAAQILT